MSSEAGLLFVYGSLMSGERNDAMMNGATFVAPALSAEGYTLVRRGDYPGLLGGGTTAIAGELYRVPAPKMAELDSFEGHPHVYRRGPIDLAGGRTVEAYFLVDLPAGGAPEIPGGDWRRR